MACKERATAVGAAQGAVFWMMAFARVGPEFDWLRNHFKCIGVLKTNVLRGLALGPLYRVDEFNFGCRVSSEFKARASDNVNERQGGLIIFFLSQ